MIFIRFLFQIISTFHFFTTAYHQGNQKYNSNNNNFSPNDNKKGLTKIKEPEFVGLMRNITVHVGKEAILACTISNMGNYKLVWVRENDQTILSLQTKMVSHSTRMSVTFDGLRTWELRIRNVKETDNGCYMCEINTHILKVQKGCVEVYVSPDIISEETSGDVSALEGETACLSCRAIGRPQPRIIWKREDRKPILLKKNPKEIEKIYFYNGSQLQLSHLERSQMGAYLCIASNEVPPAVSKRIVLNVIFSPVIKVPNQLLGAPIGTTVTLECNVEAFPNTINYWIKDKGEMLLNGSKYAVREERENYKTFMGLIIRKFFANDVGTYNCVSTNSLGKAEGTIRLYEIKLNRVGDDYTENDLSGGFAEAARENTSRKSFQASTIKKSNLLLIFLISSIMNLMEIFS